MLLILFPKLVLMLLMLGWVHPSLDQEKPAMKFMRQHIDPKVPSNRNLTYCNKMMKSRNITRCKKENTFVHASWKVVKAVCHENLTLCKNGKRECHRSNCPMKLTHCVQKVPPKYSNCKYRTNQIVGYISVVCNGTLPVHFDSFNLMSEREDTSPPNRHGFSFPLFREK